MKRIASNVKRQFSFRLNDIDAAGKAPSDLQISCGAPASEASNRRTFLSSLCGAAALAVLGNGSSAEAQSTTSPAVTDYLNLLLNLEYLEANLYLYVTTGAGLSSTNNGGSTASVTGASKLTLDATTTAVAQALAADETLHVQQLRSLITSLGGNPVQQPAINLVANLSGKTAITTQAQFVILARQLNALSSAAYAGMAPLVSALNSAVVAPATQILAEEGQHAGVLNYLCVSQSLASVAIDSQDVIPTSSNYFTAQATTAFSPALFNTSDVLLIAYGITAASGIGPLNATQVGVVKGGFFPSGVNGAIVST